MTLEDFIAAVSSRGLVDKSTTADSKVQRHTGPTCLSLFAFPDTTHPHTRTHHKKKVSK